jgi:hypothetical protein
MRIALFVHATAGSLIGFALLLLACAGPISQTGSIEQQRRLAQKEQVAAIKTQIDPLITCEAAMDSIEAVRGQVVKWHGDIIRSWNDKLLIASQGREESWNHFVLLLDHPLPRESTIGELVQTVSRGDAIYAAGRIIDLRTIVLKSGSDLTIPHLECFIISKENDRQFGRPVWVANIE